MTSTLGGSLVSLFKQVEHDDIKYDGLNNVTKTISLQKASRMFVLVTWMLKNECLDKLYQIHHQRKQKLN